MGHFFSSSLSEAIALSNPKTITHSLSPYPVVIAVEPGSLTVRRLMSMAATSPVAAPIRAPKNKILPLLSMLTISSFPEILLYTL